MSTREIPLFSAPHTPEMETVAIEVLRSGQIASGPYVKKFEECLASLLNQRDIVTLSNYTQAILLALKVSNIGAGDEVITTAYSCLGTTSAIVQAGAKVVWADTKSETVEIDLIDLENKITSKTKAVVVYHTAGYPSSLVDLDRICKNHNLVLIEDCNNSLFATRDGVQVGTVGDFAAYSFYPNRQINTAEGGALACKRSEFAAVLRSLRKFGINPDSFRKGDGEINPDSDVKNIGYSCGLGNLSAALGFAQLKSIRERSEKTRRNALFLYSTLVNNSQIRPIHFAPSTSPDFWVLLLLSDRRDEVLKTLHDSSIGSSALHFRNDLYSGFGCDPLPIDSNTSVLQKKILAVPCGWWLTSNCLERVSEALLKF